MLKNNTSYNYFLFQTRNEMGMSKKKFAKLLDISSFKYSMLESGYIKPSKKDIAKISKALNVDYSLYQEGVHSYPTELPDPKRTGIAAALFRGLGKRGLRITLVCLTFLFTTIFISGLVSNQYCDHNYQTFYSENVIALRDAVVEKGEMSISLTGDSVYPIIYSMEKNSEEKTEKMVYISSSYDKSYFTMSFKEMHWSDTARLYISFTSYEDNAYLFSGSLLDYSTNMNTSCHISYNEDNTYTVEAFVNEGASIIEQKVKNVLDKNDVFNDFSKLIKNKVNLDLDFKVDVAQSLASTASKTRNAIIATVFSIVLGLVLAAASLFATAFAFIYGESEVELKKFQHGDELLFTEPPRKKITKNDIRFTAFLPETLLELVGIAIVAIGAFRIVLFSTALVSFSSEAISLATGPFLSIQMLGMFLLYFVDFDLFMDDQRAIRNIVQYSIFFFVLYFIEATLMSGLQNSNNILIANSLANFMIPNPFGSAACYFAIMVFLFFTPKKIRTRRGLIAYRCLAILPIACIITSFLISHGDNLFGWDMSNLWLKYFFNGERISYSLLAIGYLVGLFFLRLYFKKKYGEETAQKMFMSNKFIMLKNILAVVVLLIIWFFELAFAGNAQMNKVGIGINGILIFIAPLLLFYHSHKGPRNMIIDYITLILYFLALLYPYVVALMVIASA